MKKSGLTSFLATTETRFADFLGRATQSRGQRIVLALLVAGGMVFAFQTLAFEWSKRYQYDYAYAGQGVVDANQYGELFNDENGADDGSSDPTSGGEGGSSDPANGRVEARGFTGTNQVNLEAGRTTLVYLDLKNTGYATWQSDGTYPFRLGTDRPRERQSVVAGSKWLTPSRPGSFNYRVTSNQGKTYLQKTTAIAPGETARFVFTMRGPQADYSGREYFRPVLESRFWLGRDFGIFWQVNARDNSYRSQWVGQGAYPTASNDKIGQTYIDYKNTGTAAWKRGEVRLGTSRPLDRYSLFSGWGFPELVWPSENRVDFAGIADGDEAGGTADSNEVADSESVRPGQVARFIIPLDARGLAPDSYREDFRLVWEGRRWLEDYGVFFTVTVTDANRADSDTSKTELLGNPSRRR